MPRRTCGSAWRSRNFGRVRRMDSLGRCSLVGAVLYLPPRTARPFGCRHELHEYAQALRAVNGGPPSLCVEFAARHREGDHRWASDSALWCCKNLFRFLVVLNQPRACRDSFLLLALTHSCYHLVRTTRPKLQ